MKRCHGTAHVPGCRPARPLCRVRRREQESRRPCFCGVVHYPHRRGWCASGAAAATVAALVWGPGAADLERAAIVDEAPVEASFP